MWTMIQYEFRKLFRTPVSILLPLIIFLLPLGFGYFNFTVGTNQSMNGTDYSDVIVSNGVRYEGWAAYEQKCKLFDRMQGEMDAAWYEDKQAMLQELLQKQDQDHLSAQMLLMDIMQIRPFTQGAMWRKDANFMELFGHEGTAQERAMSPFIISEMDDVEQFTYGSYENWKFLTDCMSCFALLFAFYIAVQAAMLYNSEHTYHMMDEIKSGYIGKFKIGSAKLIMMLSLAIMLPLLAILCYTVITWAIFGLQNGDVTLAFYHSITPFTYLDMYLQGTLIILVASVSITAIFTAVSTKVKSTYVSVAMAAIFLIFPLFFTMQSDGLLLSLLFPTFYLMLCNVFASFSFLTILSHTMYYRDYIFIQTTVCALLGISYTIWKYRQYEQQ